ncbi:MAG TPA: hypothetical protein VFH50_10030 [Acidimicrobiales bacterium]|nr:hypothetical protein [Acidimicrobiales bacterium]
MSPGQGSSYAQALQVTPHEGSLAIGPVFGEALAGHTNNYSRAQSQGLDLGAIGTSMKSYNCGSAPQPAVAGAVPSPLEVEAGQPGADQGQTRSNPQQTYGATEFGRASATPYAEADTTLAPLPAGVLSVTGAQSKAWSGLVKGQRVAGATSDIGSLSLAGGAVVLSGLHWDVAYPSSGSAKPSGSFGVSKAAVNGTPVPTGDLGALASAANKVLGNFGMKLVLPRITDQQGIESVTPLELDVVPNQNRDSLVDAGLNAIGPAYQTVTHGLESGFGSWEPSQLEQALCQSDTPITVADITLASISGAGFFNAAFGGVNATSKDLPANAFNLSLPSFSLGGGSQFVPGTAGTPGTAGSSFGSALSSGAALSSGSAPSPAGTSSAAPTPGPGVLAAARSGAGGPLLALGLAGLAGVLALAEADRRAMRPARRAHFQD